MKQRLAISVAAVTFCALLLGVSSASAAPPKISKASFTAVKVVSVVLVAEINPEGKATTYHFEYGPDDCSANSCVSVPVPDGQIPKGSSVVSVRAAIKGLTENTTYHFRVVAKNGQGPADISKSPDKTFTTRAPEPGFGHCSNDLLRNENPVAGLLDYSSGNLPDCRAYEQASPVGKNAVDTRGRVSWVKASVSGDAVSFLTVSGIPGGEGAQELPPSLSSRGAGGWSTQGLLPPASAGQEAFVLGWTPDFSQVFESARRLNPPKGTAFLARFSASHALAEIVPYTSAVKIPPSFAGASADGSRIVFESTAELLPDAIAGKSNVYVWERASKKLDLVSTLPGSACATPPCVPPEGAFAGSYDWIEGSTPAALARGGGERNYYTQDQHAISADGRRVYFTAGATGQLYMRLNPTEDPSPLDSEGKCANPILACTLHVSSSRKTNGTGPDGTDVAGPRPAAFMAAGADGSISFFTSPEKLTNEANTGPEPEPPTIGRADVDGNLASLDLDFLSEKAAGIAVDGSHIYWASPEEGTIGRAKLNGSGIPTEVESDFITGANHPQGVAINVDHIYWTNAGEGKAGEGTIGRAKLGSVAEEINQDFIKGASDPRGIAVDPAHIYWTNLGTANGTGTLSRANLDGTGAEPFGVDSEGNLRDWRGVGLAVDSTFIYFTSDFGTLNEGGISRIPLANLKQFPESIASGAGRFRGLAVDASHIYWTNTATSTIGRANLDGTEKKEEFIKDAGHPLGLAVDSSHIYWSANQALVPNPGNDLYRYDAKNDELTDLTIDPSETNGAEVKGLVGASADASYVYFVANGVLAPGAVPGNCQGAVNASTSLVFSGECNLYLAHESDSITFIARLDANGVGGESDAANWLPHGGIIGQTERTARVSADGHTLLFRSQRQLSAYENEGIPEFYRYRLGDTSPTCVSCDPTNVPPSGIPGLGSIGLYALLPSNPAYVLSRNLSTDGNRVFFETTDALVAADVNGEEGCPEVGTTTFKYPVCQDVYEWEAKGAGSCGSEVQGGGCVSLLSSGKSPEASFFADASASGNDAFLITSSKLVGQDQDQLYDVYDASVNGGLASQNTLPPTACLDEGCKPQVPPPPASEPPGTVGFLGPGNINRPKQPRCPKGKRKVRSKGKTRCVPSRHKHHSHRAKTTGRASR